MALKDLRELGVLLPDDEWGTHDLHGPINRPAVVLAGLLAAVAIALICAGNGGTLTLVGAGLFLVFMAWATHISIKAIDRQADQFERERETDAAAPLAEPAADSAAQSPQGSA